jgi:hypothetical protein
MKKQIINEEFRRMQKLAGISLNENFENFQNSDEMGWMEVTMEKIAQEQDLDIKYRSDFNIAFEEAMNILKKEQPQLDFNLIQKFKEQMF